MPLRINPALNADIPYASRAMGHGDDLVICDTNFLADSMAQQTVHGKVLRMENLAAARAMQAILSVLPLGSFVDHPVKRMEVVDYPSDVPSVQAEVDAAAMRHAGRDSWLMGSIKSFAFYRRAKKAYALIVTKSGASTAVSFAGKASSHPISRYTLLFERGLPHEA